MGVDEEEKQQLVAASSSDFHSLPLVERDAHSPCFQACLPRLAPVFIVALAFFGIGFYFSVTLNSREIGETVPTNFENMRDIAAPTILISIDGFRHEYLSRKTKNPDGSQKPLAPNLDKLATQGVYAEGGMQPVVPTKTFPNHWALVTGLYPENSGIIENTMYDPVRKSWFHIDRSHPDWWFGSPIWQTLRETRRVVYDANGTRTTLDNNYTTACVFWPGSDVPKHAPDAYWKYDGSVEYKTRVDRAISLLKGDASDLNRKANFITLYFEGVDHAGHRYGPHSTQVESEIQRVDDIIGYLLDELGGKASEDFNLVIVSDHGMTEISPERSIDLEPVLKKDTVQDITVSPVGFFLNMTVTAEELYGKISAAFKPHADHADVYRKENLPERWHLRESRLVTPVVTMASLGWTVEYPHQHLVPDADRPLDRTIARTFTDKGNHGFDNIYQDMQAVFIGRGPAFRKGSRFKNMRSIDMYEMICHIFGAHPAPNNGSLETTLLSALSEDLAL